VIIGGVTFTLGLFWFGWSGYRSDIHWIVPTLSGLFTGFGLRAIFLQSLNYLLMLISFCKSAFASSFPFIHITSCGTKGTNQLQRCISNSGKHLRQVHCGRCLPLIQHIHVRCARHQLDRDAIRVHGCHFSPDPGHFLEVWRQDTAEEYIRPNGAIQTNGRDERTVGWLLTI